MIALLFWSLIPMFVLALIIGFVQSEGDREKAREEHLKQVEGIAEHVCSDVERVLLEVASSLPPVLIAAASQQALAPVRTAFALLPQQDQGQFLGRIHDADMAVRVWDSGFRGPPARIYHQLRREDLVEKNPILVQAVQTEVGKDQNKPGALAFEPASAEAVFQELLSQRRPQFMIRYQRLGLDLTRWVEGARLAIEWDRPAFVDAGLVAPLRDAIDAIPEADLEVVGET